MTGYNIHTQEKRGVEKIASFHGVCAKRTVDFSWGFFSLHARAYTCAAAWVRVNGPAGVYHKKKTYNKKKREK